MRMSAGEAKQLLANSNSKPSKYRNTKVELDNHTFDSKAEARRYNELKLMKQAGEIKGFDLQPSFPLGKKIRYRPDFIVCGRDGTVWVEDVKGMETKDFKLKQKLWEERYWWMELRVIKY